VAAHFPDNRLKSSAPLHSSGTGTHLIHLYNRPFKVVLKLLDEEESRWPAVESRVERLLEGIPGVQVPRLLGVDESGTILANPYAIRSYLPGLPWGDVLPLLPPADSATLAEKCGALLGAFHGVTADSFGEIDGEENVKRWSGLVLGGALEDLEKVVLKGWIGTREKDRILKYLLGVADLLDEGGAPRLTHRRLTPRDILVRSEAGEWITTGLLGTGGSAFWDYLWDVAALRRELAGGHDAVLEAVERGHRAAVPLPVNFEKKLAACTVIESLHHLARSGDGGEVRDLLDRIGEFVGE
jgi:hypothetical protein